MLAQIIRDHLIEKWPDIPARLYMSANIQTALEIGAKLNDHKSAYPGFIQQPKHCASEQPCLFILQRDGLCEIQVYYHRIPIRPAPQQTLCIGDIRYLDPTRPSFLSDVEAAVRMYFNGIDYKWCKR